MIADRSKFEAAKSKMAAELKEDRYQFIVSGRKSRHNNKVYIDTEKYISKLRSGSDYYSCTRKHKIPNMNELPFFDTPELFQKELKKIASNRKSSQVKSRKRNQLNKKIRQSIHAKTGGKCHVCGDDVAIDKFEADHVKSHSSGGRNETDNFLPSCRTCNNYRWHYSPQEFKWILKLGVWARTQIANDTNLGKLISVKFINLDKSREKRRKFPRRLQSEIKCLNQDFPD